MNSRACNTIRALATSAMAVVFLLGGRMCCAQAVSVTFSLSKGSVTLNEPVYLQFSLRNGSAEELRVDLGADRAEAFSLSVRQPNGSTVRPRAPGGNRSLSAGGDISVAAGQTYSQKLLVNEWYKFMGPGQYTFQAALTAPVKSQSGKTINTPAAPQMPLTVQQRNPKILEEVCRGLATTAIESGDYQSASEAALALGHVRDVIAVPYLGRVLRESKQAKEIAIPGLVRIGNTEAVKVLSDNLNTQDPELKAQIQAALKEIKTGIHPQAVDSVARSSP